MPQQVFIKVVGFTDVERHALNTLFRLSEDRPTSYSLWTTESAAAPQLVLLDGQSYEARVEAESPYNASIKQVWVGDEAPDGTWRSFPRPLAWPDVVEAIDEIYVGNPDLSFDLDLGDNGPDTVPPDQVPEPPPVRRALIACPDLGERLYLRAKLALHHLTVADEAENAAQALELMRDRQYVLALVDLGLPGGEGWAFVNRLANGSPRIPHVIAMKQGPNIAERLRGWFANVDGFLPKPPDPEKLHELLARVN
ncbi:MAG: response regulator [Burkholderiales bacterium]|nr:response regulator [Burkholderiales bacterium]